MSKKNLEQQENIVWMNADVFIDEYGDVFQSLLKKDQEIYVSAYDENGYVVGGYGSLEHAMECKPNHMYEIKLIEKK